MNKEIKKSIQSILLFLGYWVVCSIAMAYIWLSNNFQIVSLDLILYHLQFGFELSNEADPAIINDFLWYTFGISCAIAILLTYFATYVQQIKYIKTACSPVFFLIICLSIISYKLEVPKYIRQLYGEDYIAKHYVSSSTISASKKTKNLILVYVESLENTYSNPQLFGEDLLSSLNSIPGQSFNNYTQVHGTGCTIAGMVSTMCGIPLKPLLFQNDSNEIGVLINKFLPNISCLGDILKRNGYKNVFLGGASLAFAGKGKFLAHHGYDEMYGREEFSKLNNKEYNGWGMLDYELFAFAKTKIDELESSGQKYNLTLLTLDLHTPNGHISQYCAKRNAKNYTDIIKCTNELLYDFITYLQKKNYLTNTNIVIIGDHLSFNNPILAKYKVKFAQRAVFNKFISTDYWPKHRETIVHFDMLPTILNFLGFKIEGAKIGLGISGFSDDNTLIIDQNRIAEMNENILNNSPKYKSFWIDS